MKLRAIAGWTALATAFCWGLWTHLGEFGIHDWDYHLFHQAVPSYTLLEFGQFPSWNPYYCGGNPLFAHPESRFLTPMFVFELLWGPVVGTRLEIWAHLVVGLIGMHVVAVHVHGLRRWAALLPPVVFMMSGAYAYHLAEGHTHFLPLAYVPWVYFSYHRSLDDFRYLALTAGLVALMIFEGGIYVTSHAALLVGLLGALLSVQRHQWRPITVAAATLALTPMLAAVKLIPMVDFLAEVPRRISSAETVPISLILTALFSRDQSLSLLLEGQDYGWWEYANYIGVLSGLLSLVGIVAAWRQQWPLLVVGIVFLELAGGAWAPVAPWPLLHQLPLFDSYHVPSRFLYIFTFTLSLFAGMGLSRLDHLRPQVRFAGLLVVMVITADLLVVNSRAFDTAAAGPIAAQERAPSFSHITGTDHQMFAAFLQNRGTLKCYEPVHYPTRAIPASAPDYRGEVFLTGEGTAQITSWSPNRVVVAVSGAGELTLNQNYARGWQTESGQRVYSNRGLVTTLVESGDREMTLYYRPPSLMWGVLLSVAAAIGSIFFVVSRRFQ
jgi:hypothetical protein